MNIKRLVLSALVVGTSSYLTGCSIGSPNPNVQALKRALSVKVLAKLWS